MGRNPLPSHPTRQAILDLVRNEPGSHFSKILDRLSTVSGHPPLGYGSLSYHLYQLERAGLVASRRSGRHRRYYDARAGLGSLSVVSTVQRVGIRELADLLSGSADSTIHDLARTVTAPASRHVIAYRIRVMEQVGLVTRERVGRRVRIVATDRLRQALSALAILSLGAATAPLGHNMPSFPSYGGRSVERFSPSVVP